MGKLSPWPLPCALLGLLCLLLCLSTGAAAERRPDFRLREPLSGEPKVAAAPALLPPPDPPDPPAPETEAEPEPEPEADSEPATDPETEAEPEPESQAALPGHESAPDADSTPDASPRPRIATLVHQVLKGETLSAIAARYRVPLAALLDENPGLAPDRLRAGATLTVESRPASLSVSVGTPARGRLQQGRQLPPGHGYVIRELERAFGTEETVDGLVAGFAQLTRRFPHAPLLAVHDLSLRRGGRMTDHRSHQSGRDADLAYPQKRCEGTCEFEHITPEQLDAPRAFALLRYLLERDELEAVFIDYRLQKPLYEAARAQGASPEQLARWFQYPRGRSDALGVIRHFPKHDNHMHLRFRCHESDPQCRSYRPQQVQTARR